MTFFVGISVFGRAERLQACLASIDQPAEIVMVNNSSHDKRLNEEVRRLADEMGAELLTHGRNHGVAASWNLILRTGFERGHDRVLILSDEAQLAPGSLSALLEVQDQPDVGLWVLCPFDCFAVLKDTTDQVGWFDENFYGADGPANDYRYRCTLAGLRCTTVPGAAANVIGSKADLSLCESEASRRAAHQRDIAYYRRKWGGGIGSEAFICPFGYQQHEISYWPAVGDDGIQPDLRKPDGNEGTTSTTAKASAISRAPANSASTSPTRLPANGTLGITGVILARNEQKNITACIESIRPHVDELILIDMESTDRTVELARPHVEMVLTHPLVAQFDAARNLAIDEAGYDWLWYVDADERVPAETGRLVRKAILDGHIQAEAISIPFKSYFSGRWMQHCGWWPGYTMPRVLKRGHFRFADRLHGGVEVDGRQARVPADPRLGIDHYSYESVEHYLEKLNRYTSTEAQQMAADSARFDWKSASAHMMHDLWWYYEQNPGHRDGAHGWILSWLSGQYRWLTHAKLLDLVPAESGRAAVPADLDQVLDHMGDQLQALRRRSPRLPLDVLWRSPLVDPTGYAAESRAQLKGLSAGSRCVTTEEIRWNDSVCELTDSQQALIAVLSRTSSRQSLAAITNCIPTLVEPDGRASLNILRTTFETDRVPPDWLARIAAFDEVWVISQANALAFRQSGVVPEKVRVVPSCLDTELFTPHGPTTRLPEPLTERFVFLSVFDWQLRKGWDVLLAAYAREFRADEGAGLLLKYTRGHGHSPARVRRQAETVLAGLGQSLDRRPDIVLWEEELSETQMAALYRSVGSFALASRGEGWGRPYMEAMACGLPVIGTAASGNIDFMNDRNSSLVPARQVEVSDEAAREIPVFSGHRWYEPDAEVLRKQLRKVFSSKHARRKVARRAAADVARHFNTTRGAEALETALRAAESKFRPIALPQRSADAVRVTIDGEILAGHSFSRINEELCHQFSHDPHLDISVERRVYNPPHPSESAQDRLAEALSHHKSGQPPQVTIRHAYPPLWEPPASGAWVHIQPWEYGVLPKDWIAPLRDRVDEIWAPSNYVRDVYKRSGIATEKIQVIPWGIDPGVFNPQVPPLHLDSASDFRFLFVGGTIRRKGFDTLLAAYTEEFSPDEPVSLVIKDMGTSSFYRIENHAAQIRAAQADASKPKIVYLDDFLSDGQMASLYRACDVLVSPYRGEGFGLPILEGMACGLAPMVTHGGPSDDFVDSDCGIFLESREVPCQAMHEMAGVPTELEVSVDELREKLRWAYENREAVDELGVAAANRAAAHSWSETARLMTERIDVLAGKVRPDVRCSPPPSSSPKEPSADTPIRRRSPQPCLPPSSSPKEPSADTPTISMCMIARESAETIRAALESVRPWVDEMVVVDTGSKDDTAKIANEAGAKVHYFKWIDDFSAARNASIEHASGDWVFWMDSDDTISAENGMKLRELLANTPADDVLGFVMQVHCPPSPDKRAEEKTVVDHVKLFRNRPDLRFERRIHEQILAAIRRAGGQIEWSDVYVEHTGYDHTHEGQTRKRERDFRLLELELADCPGDPFTLFNLGMTHADVGQHQEAIKYLQQSIEAAGPDESHLRKAYALLASSLRSTGRRDEANGTCREGLMKHPSDVELLFQLGVLLYESGQPDEALDAYQQLLEVPAGDEYFSSRDSSLQGYKAHQNMAVIYADLARHKDAETSWWQVVELLPDYTTAWRGLVESLIAQRKCSAALDLARQLSGRDDLAAFSKLLEARVLTEIGRPGEVRKLLERAYIDVADDAELLAWLAQQQFDLDPADALPALGRLVEVAPSDPAAHHNLGIAHLARGESERALAALRRSLELRPDSADTRSQLEQALVAAEKLGSTVQSHPSHPQEEPDAQQAAQSLAPAQTA